ncbi:MAG: SLC13 family permease [Streptosporangiales bacterium]
MRRIVSHVVWRWVAVAGATCVVTTLLPLHDAMAVTVRIAPILTFLVAITVVAELADRAEVFDLAALEAARLGGGHRRGLYGLVLALGTLTTAVLGLDTTAVLVTPVVLSVARQLRLPTAPFALAAVWLANTGSLFLPVSNLTNLLAADRLDLSVIRYASLMWLPALATTLATAAVLLTTYRRQLRGRYAIPPRRRPRDPVLFWGATAVSVGVVPAFIVDLPVWAVACAGMVVLAALYAARRPGTLRLALIPWRLVVLVWGLFLVVDTLDRFGLRRLLATLAGNGTGALDIARTVGVTAVLANLANNLPAYYAMEAAVGDSAPHLLGVLLGANAGPVVLLWGSLATLLWRDRCRARGVPISARHFTLLGLAGAPLVLAAGLAALLLRLHLAA